MSMSRLTSRGANANQGAKLPGLQAVRTASPELKPITDAIEALREWVETRLGSRGDAFEKAITLRDFEQRVRPIEVALAAVFDGRTEGLSAEALEALPASVRNGAFVQLKNGELHHGIGGVWKRVTLT
jgi:hypothetical protein